MRPRTPVLPVCKARRFCSFMARVHARRPCPSFGLRSSAGWLRPAQRMAEPFGASAKVSWPTSASSPAKMAVASSVWRAGGVLAASRRHPVGKIIVRNWCGSFLRRRVARLQMPPCTGWREEDAGRYAAGDQHRVLDGRGQFRFAASSFQCTRPRASHEYDGLAVQSTHAIVGCRS